MNPVIQKFFNRTEPHVEVKLTTCVILQNFNYSIALRPSMLSEWPGAP